jgi:hypothetical protein
MNPASPAPKAARLAADVAKPLSLSEGAAKLLAPQMTPRQFFDALAAVPAFADDAVRFLAAALPKREAVWWGVLCAKEALPKPDPAAAKAVAAAEAWVKEPSEANRRAAGAAAAAAGYGTPAGCLAAAAFWSGGSLNPPHLPPVPPKDDLTGTAIAGAVLLASVAAPAGPEAAKAKVLALGADVASGRRKFA